MNDRLNLPSAILFDLDDTILDDASGRDEAWRTVCRDAATRLDGITADSLYEAIDREAGWYWSDAERHRMGRLDLRAATARIVGQALSGLGRDAPGMAKEIANDYRDLREQMIRPFPGAVATLESLRAGGVRLALLTNGAGRAQRAKIERFDLARHFEAIFIEGEFGVGKPDERVYRTAMGALGSTPEETWSVGDNLEWDVSAPQRLGVHAVWVDGGGNGLPAGSTTRPDRIVRSVTELLDA
jgi:putative hydrolase of the HAD superfamily